MFNIPNHTSVAGSPEAPVVDSSAPYQHYSTAATVDLFLKVSK